MWRKELKDLRTRTLVFLFLFVGTFIFLVVMKDYTRSLSELLETAPKGLLERFGMTEEFIEKLGDWNFYVTTQWYGKNLGQFIPLFAIIVAFPLVAREVENQTIELLLARLSRKTVFFTKFSAPLIAFSIVTVAMVLLPLPVTAFLKETLDAGTVGKYLVTHLVGGILWYCVTFFFSILSSDQVRPLIISLALLGGTTTLGIVRRLSFLNTFAYVMKGDPTFPQTLGYVLMSALIVGLSYRIFLEKDF